VGLAHPLDPPPAALPLVELEVPELPLVVVEVPAPPLVAAALDVAPLMVPDEELAMDPELVAPVT
jgi:hypothetical protein